MNSFLCCISAYHKIQGFVATVAMGKICSGEEKKLKQRGSHFWKPRGARLQGGQRGHLTPEVEWPLDSEMAFGVVRIFL